MKHRTKWHRRSVSFFFFFVTRARPPRRDRSAARDHVNDTAAGKNKYRISYGLAKRGNTPRFTLSPRRPRLRRAARIFFHTARPNNSESRRICVIDERDLVIKLFETSRSNRFSYEDVPNCSVVAKRKKRDESVVDDYRETTTAASSSYLPNTDLFKMHNFVLNMPKIFFKRKIFIKFLNNSKFLLKTVKKLKIKCRKVLLK